MLRAHSWYQPENKWEYLAAANFIGSDARILDIGCGDGRFHGALPTAHYTGLEASTSSEAQALTDRAKIRNESLEKHSAERPGYYDYVCAFQVLEHVLEPRQFVEQALRCLAPDGRLILGMPNHETYLGGLMNFALNSPPHHLTWWSDTALGALEQELGLTRVQLQYAPLEAWERDLYWMQRWYQPALPEVQRYSARARWRWIIPMAYVAAKLTSRLLSVASRKKGSKRGSTMLWVVTR